MAVTMQRRQEDRRIARETQTRRSQSVAGCGDIGAAMLDLRPWLESAAPPNVQLEVETMSCPGRTSLTPEDLACILLHRVRRFSSKISTGGVSTGGRLRVTAQYGDGFNFLDRMLFPHARPENVVITIEERSAKTAGWVEDMAAEPVPAEIDDRVRAAGATLRRHLPPGRGMRVELEVPVT